MTEPKFIIESGAQLLARLTKKPHIENFHPILFNSGLQFGDIVEVSYECDTSWLLIDIVSEAILNSNNVGVLLLNPDGNFNYEVLINTMRKKILSLRIKENKFDTNLDDMLQEALSNLYILNIFDENQFLITVYNLENIVVEHQHISLLIFSSLTAFYWSVQGFKITKMDLYLKNLLIVIQKIIKEHKLTCIYTRPQYFYSNKDFDTHFNSNESIQKYKIILNYQNDDKEIYKVDIVKLKEQYTKYFRITDGTINWICG